jgi:chromosome partitioning protein
MPVVAVVNRKGGSGKSTLATHLAAWCANAGIASMLGDVDRQQSTQAWLKRRAARSLPRSAPIVGWVVDAKKSVLRPPSGITHVVLDTPGGLRDFELARVVMAADVILMPVCNSLFDRESAAECHAELMTLPRVASGRCKVAAVGMRLDARTRGAEVLEAWARELKLPFLGVLRETQIYVRCVEQGLAVFDLPAAQVQADLAQWRPILDWLAPVMQLAAPVEAEAAAGSATRAPSPHGAPNRAPASGRERPAPPRPRGVAVRHQVPAGVLEGAPRGGVAARVARLFGWLPRLLQRGS